MGYYSETEHVEVDVRGGFMGKLYVFRKGTFNDVEGVLVWGPNAQVTPVGDVTPTRDAKDRAVRALAETPYGRKALGLPEPDTSFT